MCFDHISFKIFVLKNKNSSNLDTDPCFAHSLNLPGHKRVQIVWRRSPWDANKSYWTMKPIENMGSELPKYNEWTENR